jgi:hypothetical protein
MLAPEIDTAQDHEERRREADLRYRRHVQELLQRREDLAGVSGLADLMCDATRWAA